MDVLIPSFSEIQKNSEKINERIYILTYFLLFASFPLIIFIFFNSKLILHIAYGEKFIPAYIVELEKLFSLIVFNYLFSNGDAHLKNFSILETPSGDYTLSPAYDLINTRIHVNDTDFALYRGLFKDNFESKKMKKNGHAGLEDFHEFANRLRIKQKRRDKLLAKFLEKQPMVEKLIQRSFIIDRTKREYMLHYQTKLNQLNAR